MSAPLPWSYRTAEVAEHGLRERRVASAAECAAIAQSLDLPACKDLSAEFVIRPVGQGRFRLKGSVTAELVQSCVVTLEPVEQRAEDDFDVEFWPVGTLPEGDEEEIEALAAAEIEPIEHGRIDVGRIVFETLSAAIDPYPRAPGAAVSEPTAPGPEPEADSPFAALRKLKDRT